MARREAARDRLRLGDVIGETIAVVMILLVLVFFLTNQRDGTGFFTPAFGTVEMVALYGGLLFGAIPPILRVVLRRRNIVRPVDVIGNLVFVVTAGYLLAVFPFDFGRLSALFPQGLKFVVDWITDDIASVLLAFAIVIASLAAVWTAYLYLIVKRHLRAGAPSGAVP